MACLAIVGAGASGLCAAIEAKRCSPELEVVLYERLDRAGKKLLATGNGRCNLSNCDLNLSHYHGACVSFAGEIMRQYGLDDTLAFFRSIGIPVRVEEKKIFPYSLQAASVLDALRLELSRLGIKLRCAAEAEQILPQKKGLILVSGSEKKQFDAIIIACGGSASPSLGGTDKGYKLLSSLGHTIAQPMPSIVQLKSSSPYPATMAGLKLVCKATLLDQEKHGKKSEQGEVLFTEYGLSGPAIFQLSGVCVRLLTQGLNAYIDLDLFPELSNNQLLSRFLSRCKERPWVPLEHFFTGLLPKRIGHMLLKAAGLFPLSMLSGDLIYEDLSRLCLFAKAWCFPITQSNGLKNAQVTAGGALTAQFSSSSLQSKKVNGLFACGEVLDIDGDCGGYNLQWAWSSGRLAGKSAAEYVMRAAQ